MSGASQLARRLIQIDPHYKSFVLNLSAFLDGGKYNRALMLDAVLLADEISQDRHVANEVSRAEDHQQQKGIS